MREPDVLLGRDGSVATITLNRPGRRNTLPDGVDVSVSASLDGPYKAISLTLFT